MAALTCDICGGKLVMGTGGVAVCDSCGMEHSKDRMQEKIQEIKGTVEVSNIANIESLMKRGRMALEESDWERADEYFDKVLDINPEYAPAYIGKLCVSCYPRWNYNMSQAKNDLFAYVLKKEADLARYYKPFDDMPDYQKAIRFADETYRAQLEGYNNERKKRIEELKKEFAFYMIIEEDLKRGSFYGAGNIDKRDLHGICHVGNLSDGFVKILRTGSVYEVKNGKVWGDDFYSIKSGDVAVITHEMIRLQKKEQDRKLRAAQEQERYIIEREKEAEREKEQERLRIEEEKEKKEQERLRQIRQRVEDKKKYGKIWKFGVILHFCLCAAYLYILYGTDIIHTLWMPDKFTFMMYLKGCLPFIIFSLTIGMVSLIFLRRSGYVSGILLLMGMILAQSITICVWRGNVGILLIYLIGRIVIITLCAIPGAILEVISYPPSNSV